MKKQKIWVVTEFNPEKSDHLWFVIWDKKKIEASTLVTKTQKVKGARGWGLISFSFCNDQNGISKRKVSLRGGT